MPSISNLNLSIQKLENRSSRVRVAYTVCFTTCEASAGSTFVETAVLRGG